MKLKRDAKRFAKLLKELGACRDGRRWAFGKTMAEAWAECDERQYLGWLVESLAGWPGCLTRSQYEQVHVAKVGLKRCLLGRPFCGSCLGLSMPLEELRSLCRVKRVKRVKL